ncbi:AMP-binding protein [Eisenibacter elegans]|uniref:AMP-binding protein n=1 Tax=Eisenibacter elegans TaxID=997 RepID=UPI0003F96790|nr:AMP-binding protein [Eisenibacter elegans]
MSTQPTTFDGSLKTTQNKVKPLVSYFYHWEKTIPQKPYLRQPYGDTWKEYTWAEVGQEARRMATALKSMFPPRTNIGLISKNCAHWITADMAISMADMVSVPFYPTLQANQLQQVLEHSECKALFVGKLDSWEHMKEGVPADVQVIRFPEYPASAPITGAGFLDWDELIAKHPPQSEDFVPNVDDISTIIYTSGTTGTPKGVVHTYYTQSAALDMAAPLLRLSGNDAKDARFFSYLPLCHIAERAIVEAASLYVGGTVSFAESLDTFAKNLAETQPTHFLAVPRIWTKFQLGVLAKMPQKKLDTFLKIPILSGIVKKKIRKALGLGEARLMLTGAAPMPATLLTWYQKLGINIQEAYGMTENAGCCTLMRADNIRVGTIGQPYPRAEVKIVPETGELAMRGDWVMTGYYKDPEKTKEVLIDGWLHTGDMCSQDQDGFITIIGRVKDSFKSAKGEYIIPAPIEFGFAKNSFVEQVCVVGRGLPQPVALIVLSEIGLQASRDVVSASLASTLKELNMGLINYERLQKVIIMKEAWSVENNLLTPTLKIKRNVVEDVYGEKLQAWYDMPDTIIWEA